jgi:hypothetical protein
MQRFYGWYVIACTFLIATWGWGLGFYGPSVYLLALQAEHGWSVSAISTATTAYYLMGAAMIAFVGAVVRRVGALTVVLTGIAAMATGVAALPAITQPWQLYVAFAILAVGWASMSGAMVNILVAQWFEHRRGMALSFAMNGASVGGVVVAPGLLALIALFGFGPGMRLVALAMVVVLVPIVVAILRRRPEPLDGARDGALRPAVSAAATSVHPMRTRAYWTISIPFGLGLAAQVGFLMHELAFLTPLIGAAAAGLALSLTAAAAMVGRVLLGGIVDRLDPRQAAALNFVIQVAGLAVLLTRPFEGALYVGCVIVGLTVGNMTSLPGLLVQRDFPGPQFASVVSFVVATNQVVFAFAPGVIGVLRDGTGGYAAALLLCMALNAIAAAVVLLGRRAPAAARLQMRPSCECCNGDLPAESGDAFICSFECTFCRTCTEDVLGGRCPNCGGELVRRPVRPADKLARYPASSARIYKRSGCSPVTANRAGA